MGDFSILSRFIVMGAWKRLARLLCYFEFLEQILDNRHKSVCPIIYRYYLERLYIIIILIIHTIIINIIIHIISTVILNH